MADTERARPLVVVTHWVHPKVVDYLSGFCEPALPTREEGVWPPAALSAAAPRAEGLVVSMADTVDDRFLAPWSRLRVVSATLKGYDNIDVAACTRRGIWCTVVPDLLIPATAELALGLMIGIGRRIGEGDREVRAGRFSGWRPYLYGSTLDGATVGILGMGELGRALVRRLMGFDASLLYHDTRRLERAQAEKLGVEFAELEALAGRSDVVVVALPLTGLTFHLLDAGLIRRMRRGAVLVNVGRGSVVDEAAVADALEAGHLGGYASDVFAMEDRAQPGRPDRVPERLRCHPRTLFTPHLGSAVDSVRLQMSLRAALHVRQVLGGERPEDAVNDPTVSG